MTLKKHISFSFYWKVLKSSVTRFGSQDYFSQSAALAYYMVFSLPPMLLVIFWFYFVMPIIAGRPLNPFLSAVIAFIIFEATYFGEIFRAGYQSISQDLSAAAYSTGLTYTQTARYILVPIAFRRMLPSLITQSIVTFQDTSLAFVIGLQEFVRRTSIVDNLEVRSIQLYGFVAIVFFIFCFIGSKISRHFEEKGRKTGLL